MGKDRKAVLVRISGRVQGVSFRVWTRARAEQLGLVGWVRNEDDGTVKALIAGPQTAVSAMLKEFWKGPPGASVVAVEVEVASPAAIPSGFQITA
ncbi:MULTISPECIES: acylphosphatase [unclassified Rhizobium]|uniref:acylphosphatase n=1 Tax=unclassified Rhizobium TaxID=2613769 RepID=UPI00160F3E15|nr:MULTISPECIES: acylphosphatase [unclassified Rhizobium]MBB3393776.1 acylphosphatase [Rhizobium sp. BK060]MBB4166500.1 acylphosphatase [Rhizobium sp. BK538]